MGSPQDMRLWHHVASPAHSGLGDKGRSRPTWRHTEQEGAACFEGYHAAIRVLVANAGGGCDQIPVGSHDAK